MGETQFITLHLSGLLQSTAKFDVSLNHSGLHKSLSTVQWKLSYQMYNRSDCSESCILRTISLANGYNCYVIYFLLILKVWHWSPGSDIRLFFGKDRIRKTIKFIR